LNLERFQTERGNTWERLDIALKKAGDRPERLGADGVRELGTLYRGAAADLAFARRRFPRDPVTARLEALVLRARACVYARTGRRASLWSFVSRTYWVRLAERPLIVLCAWAVLLVPAVGAAGWASVDPGAAAGLVPGQFEAAADPPPEGRDYDAATAAAFSAAVMTNNIGVALLAFAGGIAFGAITVISLFYNGLILGAIGGLAVGAGHGTAFLRLVSSHGPLEISCIVAGGIAGLRMGWALIRPGPVRRATALRREARPAVEIAAGTVPWLVVCGLCEGFLTGPNLPVAVQACIGAALFCLFWGLVIWRGRPARARSDTATNRSAAGPVLVGPGSPLRDAPR
jgi:uncharacterized membrane protein SpoIIM required for sporulation